MSVYYPASEVTPIYHMYYYGAYNPLAAILYEPGQVSVPFCLTRFLDVINYPPSYTGVNVGETL